MRDQDDPSSDRVHSADRAVGHAETAVPDPVDGWAEAKVASHLRMRALGVQDRRLLRAIELVSRAFFVAPHHQELSARDVPLPIGCGQTMAEPGLIARMVEALAVERAHRVLEIGAGSGYATALIAHLADTVLGLERFRGLAVAAQERLDARGIGNAAVMWADGTAPSGLGDHAFDRVIVHGLLERLPDQVAERVSHDAIVVCARRTGATQVVVRMSGHNLSDMHPVCACRLQAIRPGLTATL